ncbi:MAG: M24 family metallopeptidase, partial [Rikenellaceae bacterium]
HGLGRKLHESPEVPNYGMRGRGPILRKGMVICIEPMINLGKKGVVFSDVDGWTVTTADHKPSAHFELAVAITSGLPDVLSTFSYIDTITNN